MKGCQSVWHHRTVSVKASIIEVENFVTSQRRKNRLLEKKLLEVIELLGGRGHT